MGVKSCSVCGSVNSPKYQQCPSSQIVGWSSVSNHLDVTRGSVNRWLKWYEADGLQGLLTVKPPGPPRKLTDSQRQQLTDWIEGGPLIAGYQSGVWTGPMIGDLILERFGVSYHKHNVPKLLHELGFSLQRPRKKLARAAVEAQTLWIRKRLPGIKKARACRGVVLFGDEASFWLDGSLHRTWARVGQQPHVETYGLRKTAHVYRAVSLQASPRFHHMFATVFNGNTFFAFLKKLVRTTRRKLFLIIDNGPCHNLQADGVEWLQTNRHRIELHRLPAYSPNLNPSEGSGRKPRSARLTTVSSRPRTNGTRHFAKHSSGSTQHQKCLPVRSRGSFDP